MAELPLWTSLFTSLTFNFSLLVTLTYLGTRFRPLLISRSAPARDKFIFAAASGLAAILLMTLGRFRFPGGVMIDFRLVPILVSGLACGPGFGLLSGLAAGLFRLWVGGMGAAAGTIGIILNGLAGGYFARWYSPGQITRHNLFSLAILAAFIASVPLLFTLPSPQNLLWALRAFPPFLAVNLTGLTVVVWLLRDSALTYQAAAMLQQEAQTDPLTGLANYLHLKNFLAASLALNIQNTVPVSLIMIDIDHFKHFNSQYGHLAGDKILRTTGRLLHQTIRGSDLVARYGGEEFVVVLPNTSRLEALNTAERLRLAVENHPFEQGPLTISVGVTSYPDPARTETELFEQADQALYQAKSQGRNRVVEYTVHDSSS